MLAKRMRLVVRAAAAISRLGDGTGPVGVQMMFEKPDLIDADAFGQLHLLELAAEHLRYASSWSAGWSSTRRQVASFILRG